MTSGGSLFSTISFLPPHQEPQPASRLAESARPSRVKESRANPGRFFASSGSTGFGMPPLKIGPPSQAKVAHATSTPPAKLVQPKANQLADYGVFLPVPQGARAPAQNALRGAKREGPQAGLPAAQRS